MLLVERRTDTTQSKVAYRNFANAPENRQRNWHDRQAKTSNRGPAKQQTRCNGFEHRRCTDEMRIMWALVAAGVWRSERNPPPLHYDTGHVTSADTTSDTKSVQKLSRTPFGRRVPDNNQTPFHHSGYTPQLCSCIVLAASQIAATKSTGTCSIRLPHVSCQHLPSVLPPLH